MKKFITAATLLAAGTMLANAITLDDAVFSTLNPTSGTSISGVEQTSFSFTFTLDPATVAAGIGMASNKTTTTAPTLVSFQFGNGSSYNIGTGVGYSSTGIEPNRTIVQTGVYATATAASSTSTPDRYFGGSNEFAATTGSGLYALEDVKSMAVTLTYSYFGASTSSTYVYTTLFLKDGTTVDFTGTQNTTIYWSSTTLTPVSLMSVNENAGISSVYVFNSALSADDAKAMNVAAISAIPEPSAFGLLAGAGALALVASRRRRSK